MSAIRVDPWMKAAECERALRTTTDSKERELLVYLQGLWLAIAHDSPYLSKDELANELEVVTQIQTDMRADMKAVSSGRAH